MSWIEDLLEEQERAGKNRTKPMWSSPAPENKGGAAGPIGSIAQLIGMAANFVPGGQVVGIPLMVGGGALKGADKGGGIGGALMGGAKAGVGAALGQGLSGIMGSGGETLAKATDAGGYQGIAKSFADNPLWKEGAQIGEGASSTGKMFGNALFSPGGNPLIPPEFGSKSPLFSAQGDPMTQLKGFS